ncbi:unnamed protein product [Bemisia tabaci]|uniref:WD repeat-containing protein 63 n=1 Tax=Bemisia tabaci TaxID=7038 RepID=A0A9P0AQ78_BEMTA|nr:unnamed protein product [Bemisia tabaci]
MSSVQESETKSASSDAEKCAESGVFPVVLPAEKQAQLKCQVGKNLFIDKTWTKVNYAEILQDLEENQAKSCFWNLKKYFKRYKNDDVLIGYEPFRSKENEFIICVTEDAKNGILEKLQSKHKEFLRRIQSSKNVVPRPWKSLGSELEIADCQVSDERDVISYEWIGDTSARRKTIIFEDLPLSEVQKLSVSLVAHQDDKFVIKESTVFDVGVQAIPHVAEEEVQTHPTIPTNACTQYAPESQVAVSSDQEKTVELHELDAFCKKYRDEFHQVLSYNEVYDLYHDDYPALVKDKQNLSASFCGTYTEYQCLNNVAASEGKHVSCIAWHTALTGVLAVAYVSKHRCETKTTESSDENSNSEKSLQNGAEESEKKVKINMTNKYLPDHHDIKSPATADQDPTEYEKDVERLKNLQKGSKGQAKRLGLRKKLAAHVAFSEHLELKKQPRVMDVRKTVLLPKKVEEVPQLIDELSDTSESSDGNDSEESILPQADEASGEESSDFDRNVEVLENIIIGDFETSDLSSTESETMHLPPIKQKPSKSLDVTKLHRGSLFPPVKDKTPKGRRQSAAPQLPALTKQKEQKKKDKKTEIRPASGKHDSLDKGILSALGLDVKEYLKEYLSPINKSQSCDRSSSKSFESGISALSASFSDGTESDGESLEPGFEFEQPPDDDFNDNNLEEDEIAPQILEPKNPVLIWSFDDDIKPKVCLDSPYELQCIKFCPHNGNLLAGGSVSGIVVLWDLAGKLRSTASSKKKSKEKSEYMLLLESMMQWQQDYSWEKVRPTAISNRSVSHLDAITCLDWVHPFIQITPNGRLCSLPKDLKSLQLITGSLDGTLKVWDLTFNAEKESSEECQEKTASPQDKERLKKKRVSIFQKLCKDWSPIYTLKVINNKMMLQPVHKFHFNFPALKFKRQPSSSSRNHAETLEDQISFSFDGTTLSNEDLIYEIVIATGSDFGVYSWEGFEFETGNAPKEEFAKRLWVNMIHDGEIVSLHRSTSFTNVVATAGGHIIALWHIDYEDGPIWWKRYPVSVTSIQFSQYKPTAFIVSRADGFVEIFDLIRQSHNSVHSFFISGEVITEIAEPILPFVSGLCAVADYTGIIRLFHVPQKYHHINPREIETVRAFLDREPERRRAMSEWNKSFKDNKGHIAQIESYQSTKEDKSKASKPLSAFKRAAKYQEEVFKWYIRRRGSFPWIRKKIEELEKREEKYVLQTVINQKKVNRKEMNLLMRPIIQEEQEKVEKYAKAEKRIKEADRIFQAAVNLLFPKPPHKFEQEMKPQKRDPSIDEMETQIIAHFGPNSQERDAEVLKRIKENPWIPEEYDWGNVLEKHDSLRRVFNDPSRKRDKKLRWLRKKLIKIAKEENCPIYRHRNHYERYSRRKLVNRYNQLEHLKNIYGVDYDLNWTTDAHVRKKLASESAEKSDQIILEPSEAETHSDLEITPPDSDVELEVMTDLKDKPQERSQAQQLEFLKSLFSPAQLKNYKSIARPERKKPKSMLRLLDASQLTSLLSESILVDQLNELTFLSDEEDGAVPVKEEQGKILKS